MSLGPNTATLTNTFDGSLMKPLICSHKNTCICPPATCLADTLTHAGWHELESRRGSKVEVYTTHEILSLTSLLIEQNVLWQMADLECCDGTFAQVAVEINRNKSWNTGWNVKNGVDAIHNERKLIVQMKPWAVLRQVQKSLCRSDKRFHRLQVVVNHYVDEAIRVVQSWIWFVLVRLPVESM
jgi:hypothetical protein